MKRDLLSSARRNLKSREEKIFRRLSSILRARLGLAKIISQSLARKTTTLNSRTLVFPTATLAYALKLWLSSNTSTSSRTRIETWTKNLKCLCRLMSRSEWTWIAVTVSKHSRDMASTSSRSPTHTSKTLHPSEGVDPTLASAEEHKQLAPPPAD